MTRLAPHPHKPEELRQIKTEAAYDVARALEVEIGDIRKLMSEAWGRRIVYRWLVDAKLLPVPCQPFDPNAMQMANNAGRYYMGSRLDHTIRLHCHNEWLVMLEECKGLVR